MAARDIGTHSFIQFEPPTELRPAQPSRRSSRKRSRSADEDSEASPPKVPRISAPSTTTEASPSHASSKAPQLSASRKVLYPVDIPCSSCGSMRSAEISIRLELSDRTEAFATRNWAQTMGDDPSSVYMNATTTGATTLASSFESVPPSHSRLAVGDGSANFVVNSREGRRIANAHDGTQAELDGPTLPHSESNAISVPQHTNIDDISNLMAQYSYSWAATTRQVWESLETQHQHPEDQFPIVALVSKTVSLWKEAGHVKEVEDLREQAGQQLMATISRGTLLNKILSLVAVATLEFTLGDSIKGCLLMMWLRYHAKQEPTGEGGP